MIRPGALAVEVVETATGAEFVGEGLYCALMFVRSGMRPRPTLEALLDRLLHEAMAVELACLTCARSTRHVPLPGPDGLFRCSACTGVRQVARPAVVAVNQPTERGAQLLLFDLPPMAPIARLVRPAPRRPPPPDREQLLLPLPIALVAA